ncbi:CDP-glycerol glycerophosphotransferase family protein [Galactobacter valiniphilus]|uniref:CDP-glycerol glycerophosphotransferase family protein n=1 Tax=Galactobacter valiniphilus TaxID=2676122 RepID=UPI0037359881
MVFVFSGGARQLYQASQWLAALSTVQGQLGVPVDAIARDARSAVLLRELTSLRVRWVSSTAQLLTHLRQARVALYPNQATLNFQALAAAEPAHVHLSHGESEKISMVSNQLKAYDFVFTAGPAARERIASHLIGFDVSRCIDVGRPQLDDPRVAPDGIPVTRKPTLLYAPTWEGDSAQMSYSSLAGSGSSIARQAVTAGYRVLYRPHPQTGSRSRSALRAHREVRDLLKAAGPEHVVDESSALGWQWDVADVMVLDPSAMALDASALGKPFIVVRPAAAEAAHRKGGLLDRAVTLDPNSLRLEEALELARSSEAHLSNRELATYHFGSDEPGSHIKRFVEAVQRVLETRTEELALRSSAYE